MQTEALRKLVPLVKAVTNPGLRIRHWTQMSETVGFKIMPAEDTLQTLLDQEVMTKMADLEEVRAHHQSSCISSKYNRAAYLAKTTNFLISSMDGLTSETRRHVASGIGGASAGCYKLASVCCLVFCEYSPTLRCKKLFSPTVNHSNS